MKNRLVQHDNWATPKEVYEKLNQEFNFDFDPCPLFHKVDGLSIDWGGRNFINPPYSRKLKEGFIIKAFEESKKGKLCVMLLPVSTSTKIFHEVILPHAEVRFWKGRINFLANGEVSPKYKSGQMDSMIVIFNQPPTDHERLGEAVMIKYFHKLTKDEFKAIVDSKKYTYEKLAKDYPQPKWCNYPDATYGMMGCWSLMGHMVKDRAYCKVCECSKDYKVKAIK